jgi:prepilin-type N-terminal cleavage/methylation domain-containing protein
MPLTIVRRGFTLIELLVVIAIIAALAAVLLPVFVEAKESARHTQCVMQAKQVAYGLIMYSNDYEQTWAPAANANSAGSGHRPQQMWIGYDNRNAGLRGGFFGDMTLPARHPPRPGAIDGYLKNHEVRVCPKKPASWQMAYAYNFFLADNYSGYYGRNPKAQGNEYGPGAKNCSTRPHSFYSCSGVTDGEIEDPAYTLASWEHGAWVPVCNFLQAPDWFDQAPAYDDRLRNHFNFLHREGSTTIWCDGHVKRTLFSALKRPMFSVQKAIYR